MKLREEPLADGTGTSYTFFCVSCQSHHRYDCRPERLPNTPNWEFDGNLDSPTFRPSLRIISSRPKKEVPVDNTGGSDMEAYTKCHLVLSDGQIHYCSDMPNEFANRTVPLPDLPAEDTA